MFYVLFALAILSRFLPHPPNFAAIGALGLFAGCYLSGKRSWLLPVAAMFVSDLVGQAFGIPGMGFYHPISMLAVYVGFAASACIGRQLQSRLNPRNLYGAAILSSTVFFLISNLGVYLAGNWSGTAHSLTSCYVAAIPFFGATLAGDLLYVTLMFGLYELSNRYEWDHSDHRRAFVPVRRR